MTEESTSAAPLLTQEQMLEDKRLLVAAMESGEISVHYAPVPVPEQLLETNEDEFEPCTFFLYGTLMDPEVLMIIAMLDGRPQMADAWIEGFEMKMWGGKYSALLRSPATTAELLAKPGKLQAWHSASGCNGTKLRRMKARIVRSTWTVEG